MKFHQVESMMYEMADSMDQEFEELFQKLEDDQQGQTEEATHESADVTYRRTENTSVVDRKIGHGHRFSINHLTIVE